MSYGDDITTSTGLEPGEDDEYGPGDDDLDDDIDPEDDDAGLEEGDEATGSLET
jgi:hypothetical protein